MDSSAEARLALQPSSKLTASVPSGSSMTWHDGRSVIRGFVVSSKPITEDKWFEPPEVPAGWEPRPSRVWNRGKKWDMTPADEVNSKLKGKEKAAEVVDGNEAWRRRQAITADQVRFCALLLCRALL